MMSDVYETLIYLASTPLQWLIFLADTGTQMLSDRMMLALMAFLMGMVVMLLLQGLLLLKIFRDQPVAPPPTCQRQGIKLPESLRNRLNHQSLKQKEDCVWLNFLTHFLFAELRDSVNVRRFLTKRIHKEFEEVLTSKTGVFVDELFLRDFSLGNKFPVFTVVCVDKCDMKKDIIETLDIRAKMIYDGGFEIAIDAALPFGRTAFICVRILKLKGSLRFQFTSNPFCHWSISFYEEPEIELDVSAQLDGRPMNKLKNIIASQIRRTLRKKHTLPIYKIRYKPFFQAKVEKPLVKPQNLLIDGIQIGSGILEVTIINASRLPVINKDAKLYCTLSVDDLPWKQLVTKERLKKPVLRKELIKNSSDQSLGLTVKDELVPDRLHPVVVVEQVVVGSPAHLADIKESDIIISVSGNKVSSAKQATKFLRSAKDKVSLQVETSITNLEPKTTRSEERMGRRFSDMTFDGEKPENTYLSNILNMQTSLEGSASTISVPSTLSSSTSSSFSSKSKKWDVRKSRLINSLPNPSWDQKFIFTVNPSTAYLNICVWSHGGDRSSRTDVIGSSNQDILIGYASLNLDDIFLHCLVTLSGTLQDKVRLKHGQYQTEAELAKEWASHKGWDPELMYGDLTLGFYFIPSLLSSNQRKSLASCRADVLRKKNQMPEGVKLTPTGVKDLATGLESQSSIDECQIYSQGHHQFDSTSFVTATFCDYCGKKIWMKEAFKCRTCNMVCHKKCLVKCLVNTFCTDGGVKKRSAQDEKWEPSSRSRAATLNTDPNIKSQGLGVDGKAIAKHRSKTYNVETDSVKSQGTAHEDGSEAEEFTSRESSLKTHADEPSSSSQHSEISNTLGRFRNLKDRTDKIKDNVLRSLKKAKSPLSLSDKEVLEAKDSGTRLFLDIEPAQRKDKLDELITHLDEQLKMEMKSKESYEKELALLNNAADSGGISTSKKRAEARALENKIAKSTEKQDTMRLLMLQYCTALQHCINVLEQDDDSQHEEPSQLSTSGQGSRVSYMGGIVKRASSSVKEKMSSIRKDFGKKGSAKPSHFPSRTESKSTDMTKQTDGRNNNRLLSTIFDGFSAKGGKAVDGIQASEESPSKGMAEFVVKRDSGEGVEYQKGLDPLEMGTIRFENLSDGETVVIKTNDTASHGEARASSLPRIQVDLKDFDDDFNLNHFGEPSDVNDSHVKEKSEPKRFVRTDSKISRSNSDSRLEISKMVSLNPDDTLRYHGNSLPKICVSDDENSESEFLVMDSSDENELSDFYEDDSDVGKREDSPSLVMLPELLIGGKIPSSVGSKDVNGDEEKQDEDSHGEDEDAAPEHRNLTQECHSYVV